MTERRFFGDISLGDWLVALQETATGTPAERREWAAECLQLDLYHIVSDDQGADGPSAAMESGDRAIREEAALANVPKAETESEARRPLRLPYGIVDSSIGSEQADVRGWLDNTDPLPSVPESALHARPRLEPLFRPRTTRALLSTALATRRFEGDVDLDRVLWHATHLRPMRELPRLPVSTMRFGIQLLVDRGPAMAPFLADQDLLIGALSDVVGRDRLEVLYFDGFPLDGCGSGSRDGWTEAYEVPGPGTPAVLLSDVGIAAQRDAGLGASVAEWRRFAFLVRGAQCPVLAIVPYARHRWPGRLRHLVSMIPWDRDTTVSRIRQLIGHGLKVAGTR